MSDLPNMLNADDFTDREWAELRLAIQAWDDYRSLMGCAECEWDDGNLYGYAEQMADDAMGCLDDAFRLFNIAYPIYDNKPWDLTA